VRRFTRWSASTVRVGFEKTTLGLTRDATSRMLSMGEALSDPVMRFLRKVADKLSGAVSDCDFKTKEDQTPVEALFE